jgi:hypothetical protein
VSGPLSEQRVSAEAVKGAGKEKEDFFSGTDRERPTFEAPSRAVTEKNTLFRWAARPIGPKPMPELRIPLTAGAFSLRYNGKS